MFRNVFEAIDQCQEQGGQLISVDSCNTLENINMELLLQGYSEGDEFLIGLFHFKTYILTSFILHGSQIIVLENWYLKGRNFKDQYWP